MDIIMRTNIEATSGLFDNTLQGILEFLGDENGCMARGMRIRTSPELICWVRKSVRTEKSFPLRVVSIPNNATDWVLDIDGSSEYIIAVVDGKLRFLYPDMPEQDDADEDC